MTHARIVEHVASGPGDSLSQGGNSLTSESAPTPPAHPSGEPDDDEAWLWSPPDEVVTERPVLTELESLPLDKLIYRDAERLFLCLLETEVDVTYAKSYGLVGQAQEGIDVYGRLRVPPARPELPIDDHGAGGAHDPDHAHEPHKDRGRREHEQDKHDERQEVAEPLPPRRYVALQSKRVKSVAPGDIKNAVTKFLEGSWPQQSTQFYYATTFDFRDKNLDKAIRDATERLKAKGVEFIPWDAERLNELLRDQPRLVERFFGLQWVGPFCGPDRIKELPNTRLDPKQTRLLRTELRALYQAVFVAFASLRPAKSSGPLAGLELTGLHDRRNHRRLPRRRPVGPSPSPTLAALCPSTSRGPPWTSHHQRRDRGRQMAGGRL
jgi:hypothetical protein